MGSNDVKVKDYKCPSENQIKKLEQTALTIVKVARQKILSNEIYREPDTDYIDAFSFGDFRDKLNWWIIPKLMKFSKFIGGVNYFFSNEKCNG